jgi:hypothetical protein
MMQPLMIAARRLAEALRAENEALARLDLVQAAALATPKRQASDAFAAAYAAARGSNARIEGADRAHAEEIAIHLKELSSENRRLLERAIDLQARVIETIAGAARAAPTGTYGERGFTRDGRAGPVSVASRF